MSLAQLNFGRRRSSRTLDRVVFKTSRLGEFCGQRELVMQTGHAIEDWPLVILKELVDNPLDAAEEAQIAPAIDIQVSTETGEISVVDNGPGILAETISDILDYRYRVSSREAYASPTRGALGNALNTLVAMPLALHDETGTTVIEAQGSRHTITFKVDQLRQSPAIDHKAMPLIPRRKGTRTYRASKDSRFARRPARADRRVPRRKLRAALGRGARSDHFG